MRDPKNPSPSLGSLDAAHQIPIDVDRLIETRMLVQANSGGGKSRTLRRLFEQTYDHVQHIIIDWDGEFHTLREEYDYILAAPHGGDCVANLESAALLATRLLEVGTSAIIDISELGPDRIKFVKRFLESVMLAPRALWHRVLIGIDEAHRFAPEAPANADELECCAAVVSLMSDGRKRGFCGVLATQRISKLDKNAAAECNNLLIGRASLDLDIRRAAGVIGMSAKDARNLLPHLKAGEFYVVGPALTPTVERIRMGPVVTTHPTAGTGGGPPTPPTPKIRAMLAKLGDLPAEAAEEAKTTEQLRAKVRELEGDIRRMVGAVTPDEVALMKADTEMKDRLQRERDDARASVKALEIEVAQRTVEHRRSVEVYANLFNKWSTTFASMSGEAAREAGQIVCRRTMPPTPPTPTDPVSESPAPNFAVPDWNPTGPAAATRIDTESDGVTISGTAGLSAMQRAILTVLAQRGALSKKKILIYADYKRSGSTDRAFAALFRDGLVDAVGQLIEITPTGRDELGEVPPLVLVREIPEMQRKLLVVLAQHKDRENRARVALTPAGMAKKKVLLFAGYARSGSTDRAWAALAHNEWIHANGGDVEITQDGLDALGPFEKLPTGQALRDRITAELSDMQANIFTQYCYAYPQSMTKARVLELAGYKRSGSTDRAFAHLTAREWVVPIGDGHLAAAKELFE